MAIDSTDFDPYHKWLGIPKTRRPPTHYDLLGISLNEEDREVICSAAQQRIAFVESQRGKGRDAAVSGILYQLGEAEITLISPDLRRDYDRRLNLFHKRRRNRQIDPYGSGTQFNSRPGRVVGEDSGIVTTFLGIMVVLIAGFALMAGLSFYLPWSKLTGRAKPPQPAPAAQAQQDNPDMDAPPAVGEASNGAAASASPAMESIQGGEPSTDGWIPLFDGRSLAGWRLYAGGVPGEGWRAENGNLVLKGGKGKDIITEQQFDNFELEFEWMSNGYSGVLYRVRTGDVSSWINSLKYEINREESGALAPLFTVSNPVRSKGEFNHSRIVARGDSLQHWINGKKVVDATIGDSAWKQAISHVRFRNRPDFARAKRGHIGLRNMGDDIKFRSLRIRPLTIDPNQQRPAEKQEEQPAEMKVEIPRVIPAGLIQMELKGHTATITHLAISPDGRYIASASHDKTVRLWDRETGGEVWKTDEQNSNFYALRFSTDGQNLFVATRDKGLRIDVASGKISILISFKNSNADLATGVVDFDRVCRRIIVSEKGAASVYDLDTRKQVAHYPNVWISYVKFSESGKEYFGADDGAPDKNILRVRHATKSVIQKFPGLRDRTIAMQTSRDGKYLAAAVGPCDPKNSPPLSKVFVWEVETGNLIRDFHTPQSWQFGLDFSPDGQHLVTGGGGLETDWYGEGYTGDKTIHLWDMQTGEERMQFRGHHGAVRAVAYLPDGKSFVSAGFDGIIRVWSLQRDFSELQLPFPERLKGTKWVNTNNVTFEWTADGRFLHASKERDWRYLEGQALEVIFADDHRDRLEFDDGLTTFKQIIRGGPYEFQGRRLK